MDPIIGIGFILDPIRIGSGLDPYGSFAFLFFFFFNFYALNVGSNMDLDPLRIHIEFQQNSIKIFLFILSRISLTFSLLSLMIYTIL